MTENRTIPADLEHDLRSAWPRLDSETQLLIRRLVTHLTTSTAQVMDLVADLDRSPALPDTELALRTADPNGGPPERSQPTPEGAVTAWRAVDPGHIAAEAALEAALHETPEQAKVAGDRLRQLFAEWQAEALRDPEQALAEWEAFKADMNAARAATGEEPLYL